MACEVRNSVDSAPPKRLSAKQCAKLDAQALVANAMAAAGVTREKLDAEQEAMTQAAIQQYVASRMLDAEQEAAKQAAIQQYLAQKKAAQQDAHQAQLQQQEQQLRGETGENEVTHAAEVTDTSAGPASTALLDDSQRRPFLQDATVHSSERRLPGAVPPTPESPMPDATARGTPGRTAPAWSGRGGWGVPPPGVGLLGYPTELMRFKRTTAILSPVQSEGSNEGGSRTGTPVLPTLTLPAAERLRRHSKEALDRAGRILPTTPEQSSDMLHVSATPSQVSVMMTDRLSRQEPDVPSAAADAEAEQRLKEGELAAATASGGERQLAELAELSGKPYVNPLVKPLISPWVSGNGPAVPAAQGLSRRGGSRVELPPATSQRGGGARGGGGGGGGAAALPKPAASRGGGAAPWACFVEGAELMHRLLGCRV